MSIGQTPDFWNKIPFFLTNGTVLGIDGTQYVASLADTLVE